MKNNEYEALKKEMQKLKEICTIPAGAVMAFATSGAPEGWLACDGTEYLIAENTEKLFCVIGKTFGGDGIKTFCVPDLQGQFIRGWDVEGNVDPGRRLGSSQNDAIQGHKHKINIDGEMSSNGDHGHKVKYRTYEVGSNWGDNDKTVYEIPGSWASSDSYGGDPGTDYRGNHCHKMPNITIGNLETGTYGIVKYDVETRPKNVSLLYCIKL